MANIKELITIIDTILVEEYGIPERPETPPDPMDMLIATILSQNTNDNNSYKAYLNLKKVITNWNDLIDMSNSELGALIKPAGLTNQKTKAIKSVIEYLKAKYDSSSLDFVYNMKNEAILEELTSQKGVGVKTASCVLLFALFRNVCPVDTHVHRLVNRLSIVNAKTPEESFYVLNKDFPEKIAHRFHTNLIKHGRGVCRPKNPFCGDCKLREFCNYNLKNNNKISVEKRDNFLLLDNV